MLIDDASFVLFYVLFNKTICFVMRQNHNKTFKQKSFDDFIVARSRGQQFASLLPARPGNNA